MLDCVLCQRTGLFSGKMFCTDPNCLARKDLLDDIKSGKIPCPLCHNKGTVTRVNDRDAGITYYYCKCCHGDQLKKETKENPASCPVCHGSKKYNWFNDKKNPGGNMRQCICSKT